MTDHDVRFIPFNTLRGLSIVVAVAGCFLGAARHEFTPDVLIAVAALSAAWFVIARGNITRP